MTVSEAEILVRQFAEAEATLRASVDKIPQGRHCALAKTKLDECRLWFADAIAEVT